MSLRTVTIDFTSENPILQKEIGFIGEHNATTLVIIPPIDMSSNTSISTYSIAFQLSDNSIVHSRTFDVNEQISINLWQQLTAAPVLGVQLEGNDSDGNLIAKSKFIQNLVLMPSPCGTEHEIDTENDSVLSEIAANTAARRRIHIGTTEPADPNVDIWINPDGEAGTGYLRLRTVTVKCPSEGFMSYLSNFYLTRVCIRRSATEKLIPPNAKIFGIDFVVDGVHYFNSELKMCNDNTKRVSVNFEFFARHTEYPDSSVQNIAQIVGQDSNITPANLTEFTVYYYEMNDSVAVIKIKDESGNWQYVTTTTGAKGDTPIKGADYWTETDKQEIINATLELLPKWSGEAYY